ncbi:HAD family hydrolase [Leptospira wolffii]|uniref:HAD family hydrolase n=1 Tax=Leptospira wolffii TaxID=409998 RepID=UPI00108471C3|nr:HAD family hydrolase [Leptospira wolffii]TGK61928.1 HAD family hydrolase [Leptospira wolffii]TGK68529.1 HAD family hydrolase [Leptospira wolffii]TGK74688.1 HAD family hydrolase [Leptospira wolffii]TGL31736.1 HAD family hydrolase [Leptospira wolffii]
MAVLLDLDNTVFDSIGIYEFTIREMEKRAKILGFSSSKEFKKTYDIVRAEVKKELPNNPINRLRILYFKRMSELLFGKLDPSFVLKLDSVYFGFFLKGIKEWKKKNSTEFKKILSLLRALQEVQDLVIITNETLRTQLLKLSVLFPKDIRYKLVTSEESGAEKPSSRIFNKALSGVDPQKSYIVGDSLKDDIGGGLTFGLEAFYLKSPISSLKTKSVIEKKTLEGKEYWESPDLISALNYILSLEKGIVL